MKYRKKPVVIEAMEWNGHMERFFAMQNDFDPEQQVLRLHADTKHDLMDLTIMTLEGEMMAGIGDMIIKGVSGELYPCKPDIFEATYEAV